MPFRRELPDDFHLKQSLFVGLPDLLHPVGSILFLDLRLPIPRRRNEMLVYFLIQAFRYVLRCLE